MMVLTKSCFGVMLNGSKTTGFEQCLEPQLNIVIEGGRQLWRRDPFIFTLIHMPFLLLPVHMDSLKRYSMMMNIHYLSMSSQDA